MSVRLGYTILYVEDVEATLEFYERAFGLKRRMLDEQKNYGELETGQTRLGFAARTFVQTMMPVELADGGLRSPAAPVELGMVADDVEVAFRAALAAGATEVKPPQQKPWGQIVGYVRDPNGFLVEVCSAMP